MALNLPLTIGDSKVQQHQDNQFLYLVTEKNVKHHRECPGMINTTKVGICLSVQVGFKLFSEGR